MLQKQETTSEITTSLGRDLRGLRKSHGITLAELALMIGRSVGFVSQIERGISDPSIADLKKIAAAFEVPLSWFFMIGDVESDESEYIVRLGSRRALGNSDQGIREELLSPDLGGSFEMFRTVIDVGAEMSEPLQRETEEAGYIVSGNLDLWIDGKPFNLTAGDSFRFSHQPYRWRNAGDQPVVIIWVLSPPVY